MRILKYFIIVLILSLTGAAFYFSWDYISDFLNVEPEKPLVGNLPASGQASLDVSINETAEGQVVLKALSKNSVFDYWIYNKISNFQFPISNKNEKDLDEKTETQSSGAEIFYISEAGQIFKIDGNEEISISSQSIDNLRLIRSNQNTPKILINSGEDLQRQWVVFDPQNNSSVYLPQDTESANWSPDGKKIVYTKNNGDIIIRNIGNPSTSSGNKDLKLLTLNQIDSNIFWNKNDSIDLISKPTNYAPSTWARVNINNKNIEIKRNNIAGLIHNWSDDKKLALELNAENFTGRLNIINENGDLLQELSFLTMPEKCAWESDVLFCAIPRETKPRMRWPEEYLQRGFYSPDDIFKFNVKTGEVMPIWSVEDKAVDVWNMKVVNNGLLFINRYDKKLYEIKF